MSEPSNLKKIKKEYKFVYVPVDKPKKKDCTTNHITKFVNKYNKKNDKYFRPDTQYLKGYTYMSNSDIFNSSNY